MKKTILTLMLGLFVFFAFNSCTKPTYKIAVTPNDVDAGQTIGAGEYTEGDNVEVGAIPNEGYSFMNWTENGVIESNSENYSFTVNRDRNLIANFTSNCELFDFGAVTVLNATGLPSAIKVDVTWDDAYINDERYIKNGESTTYTEVPAGDITCWAYAFGSWYYVDTWVETCEDMLFTWESGQKSTMSLQLKMEDSNGNIEYLKLNKKSKN